MFSVFAITLIIISFGALLYIVSRHLPEVENSENLPGMGSQGGILDNLIEKIPLESFKTRGAVFAEKTLHRTRRFLLRTDNLLMSLIGKIKNGNGNGKDAQEVKLDNFWQDIAAKRNGTSNTEIHVAVQKESKSEPEVKAFSKKYKREIKSKL